MKGLDMQRRALLALFGNTAMLIMLGGCGSSDGETIRYRMRVEVETPQGTKVGSSVREVKYYTPPNIPSLGESRPGVQLVGEAVRIDLPDGQALFALLTGADGNVDYGARLLQYAFPAYWFDKKYWPDGQHPDNQLILEELKRIKASVKIWPNPPKQYLRGINVLPKLAYFKNKDDLKSIEIINIDDLASGFSKPFRLKQITVEVTNDPVTISNVENLPFRQDKTEFDDWYRRLPYGDPRQITISEFRTGTK